MPWVVEMTFTPEQAEALRLADLNGGRVEWWYLKEKAALDFPMDWLPRYGRVAVQLTIEREGAAPEIRELPPALPDPIPGHERSPEEFAKPIIAGVVKARVYRTNRRAPWLPIYDLRAWDTRHAVDRYLSGCSMSETKKWLEGVGELIFMEDVSMSNDPGERVYKYRFLSRHGGETIVDLTPWGIHIVY